MRKKGDYEDFIDGLVNSIKIFLNLKEKSTIIEKKKKMNKIYIGYFNENYNVIQI